MHARVWTLQFRPGHHVEIVAAMRDRLLPLAQQQRGFREFLLLTEPNRSQARLITLYETEEDLVASYAGGGLQQAIEFVAPLLVVPPHFENLEVDLHVAGAEASPLPITA